MVSGLEDISNKMLDRLKIVFAGKLEVEGRSDEMMRCINSVVFSGNEISNTRGHSFNVKGPKSKGDMQGRFFFHTGGWWMPGMCCLGGVGRYDCGVQEVFG